MIMEHFISIDAETMPLQCFKAKIEKKTAKNPDYFPPALMQDIQCISVTEYVPQGCVPIVVELGGDVLKDPAIIVSTFSDHVEYRRPPSLPLWVHSVFYPYLKRAITRGIPVVTFNGRQFDIPLIAYDAIESNKDIAKLLLDTAPGQFAYRYGNRHIDLMDTLGYYGAVRCGLDDYLTRFGLPNKIDSGAKIEEMTPERVMHYCEADTLLTAMLHAKTQGMSDVLDRLLTYFNTHYQE